MSETVKSKPLPHWVALVVLTAVATLAAGILAIVAASVDLNSFATDSGDIALHSALTSWANFSMIVAAVSAVGATVLAGVHALFRRDR